jgi:hypothetical protein
VQVGFLKVSDCVGLEAIFKFGSLVLFGCLGSLCMAMMWVGVWITHEKAFSNPTCQKP